MPPVPTVKIVTIRPFLKIFCTGACPTFPHIIACIQTLHSGSIYPLDRTHVSRMPNPFSNMREKRANIKYHVLCGFGVLTTQMAKKKNSEACFSVILFAKVLTSKAKEISQYSMLIFSTIFLATSKRDKDIFLWPIKMELFFMLYVHFCTDQI